MDQLEPKRWAEADVTLLEGRISTFVVGLGPHCAHLVDRRRIWRQVLHQLKLEDIGRAPCTRKGAWLFCAQACHLLLNSKLCCFSVIMAKRLLVDAGRMHVEGAEGVVTHLLSC